MDAQDLRNLQEAYMEVYYELDERAPGFRFDYNQRHGRPFITPETSQSASETETLGGGTYRRGKERLPKSKRKYDRQVLSGVRAASDQEKERARKRMGIKEDIYDIILSHLLDEGYADTEQAAEAIMVNMSEEWREEIVEGIDMKTFKANRRNIKRREASADAKSRGHVSKNIVTHGRTYSPDEAKSNRANLSNYDRAQRKSFNINPDQVGDTRETADKTKNPKKLRKQKAMGEHG